MTNTKFKIIILLTAQMLLTRCDSTEPKKTLRPNNQEQSDSRQDQLNSADGQTADQTSSSFDQIDTIPVEIAEDQVPATDDNRGSGGGDNGGGDNGGGDNGDGGSGVPVDLPSKIVAFPGAEGFGATTVGGRGGKIIKVTNLNNDGSGSLRAALEASGPRYVIFETGGIIELKSSIVIRNSHVTIAGQTAPGGGIAIKTSPIIIGTSEVIMRGIRFRIGDDPNGPPGNNRDGLNISATLTKQDIENVIIDHCSVAWGVDENISTWTNRIKNLTIQWTITSEALRDSIHIDEGATTPGVHSMGMLIGLDSTRISIHHNLFVNNDDRNPRLDGITEGEVINNIIHNYKSGPGRTGDSFNTIHWINNYYRLGPDSRSDIFRFSDSPAAGSLNYLSGNYRHDPFADENLGQEWSIVNGDQSQITFSPAFSESGVTTQTAIESVEIILPNVGAIHPTRDSVDTRVIEQFVYFNTKRPKLSGVSYMVNSPAEVGGWPNYANGEAPLDTDNDGLPNAWEDEVGTNKLIADAHEDINQNGYENIEDYLNSFYE